MKNILVTTDSQAKFSSLHRNDTYHKEIIENIYAHKVTAVVHLGDVKDNFNPIDGRVLNRIVDFVEEVSNLVPMYILRGNHDQLASQSGSDDFMHILELAGATVITGASVVAVDGQPWGFLPFDYDAAIMQAGADMLAKTNAKYLGFHCEVKGAKLNVGRTSDGPLSCKGLHMDQYVLAMGGHIHLRQKLSANAFYVGSPYAMDWNDANQAKGSMLLTYPNKIKLLPTAVPGYYVPDRKDFTKGPATWEGANVRLDVPIPAGEPVHAMLHTAEAVAKTEYAGAIIKTLPKLEESDSPVGVETDDDNAALKTYVKHTLPDGWDEDSVLESLTNYLGEHEERATGNIQFASAAGHNFLSYEDVKVKFTPGVTLVRGINEGWDDQSNGAGKTALLQLIAVALFGTTFKGQKSDRWARRDSKGKAWAGVNFKLPDGRKCKVYRQRKPAQLKFIIDGQDVSTGKGSAQTQADIEHITGLTWQTLANAVYIDQAQISEFLYGTTASRYKLLERFNNLERFDAALKTVKQFRKVAEGNQRTLDMKITDATARTKELKLQLDQLGEINVANAKVVWEQASEKLSALCTAEGEKLTNLDKDQQHMITSTQAEWKLSSGYGGKLQALKAQLTKLQQAVECGEDLAGQECPSCHQVVPASHVKKHVTELRAEIEILAGEISSAHKGASEHAHVASSLEGLTRDLEQNQVDIRGRIQEMERHVSDLSRTYEDAAQLEAQADGFRTRGKELADGARKKIKERKQVVKDIQLMAYCEQVFHRDGLPSYMGKLFYPRLNRAAREYSEMFTDGQIQVRFNVVEDGIEPEIINVAGGEKLTDQSEGERRLASIITSFALREVARPCNVLILDEPGMGLSPHNARSFAKTLKDHSDRFGSVLLVTHSADMESVLAQERTLLVTKRNRISEVTECT